MKLLTRAVPLSVLLFSTSLPSAGAAETGAPAGGELKTGWHIVRPGDTLRGIARRYAGSQELWKRLSELNPGIANPDVIEPGQRVQVLLKPDPASPSGQLRRLSRQVEEQPSPNPWLDARRGDVLVDRDAVRTAASSSAEIEFADGARLTLTEDSLVFLHRAGGALRAAPSRAVEIVQGTAEFENRGARAAGARADVELIVGSARATAAPDEKGVSQTRARRAEGGAAKVMIYGGKSEVAAGGAKIAVGAGMGTSVEAQGPPGPPEKLLPAPALDKPENGAQRACTNPTFQWQPVAGAASYILELCKDAGCAELTTRKTDLTTNRWPSEGLAVGDLYWRVTARSASGLDGYPSASSRLTVLAGRGDVPAPEGALQVTGPNVRVGDRLFVSGASKVGLAVADSAADWSPSIDGQPAGAGALSPGDHTIAVAALDGCGNAVPGVPIPFTVDTAAPVISWELGARKDFEDKGVLAGDNEEKRRRRRNTEPGKPAKGFWPSVAGVWQVPLPWAGEDGKKRPQPVLETEPLVIVSDHPQAFLRLRDSRISVDGKEENHKDGGNVLWIKAEDAGAGVDRMTLREEVERDRVILVIEVVDAVGNGSRKEIVVRGDDGARRGRR